MTYLLKILSLFLTGLFKRHKRLLIECLATLLLVLCIIVLYNGYRSSRALYLQYQDNFYAAQEQLDQKDGIIRSYAVRDSLSASSMLIMTISRDEYRDRYNRELQLNRDMGIRLRDILAVGQIVTTIHDSIPVVVKDSSGCFPFHANNKWLDMYGVICPRDTNSSYVNYVVRDSISLVEHQRVRKILWIIPWRKESLRMDVISLNPKSHPVVTSWRKVKD